MDETNWTHRVARALHLLVAAALLSMTLVVAPAQQASSATSTRSAIDGGQGSGELLQFTAGGHVLGFEDQGVYVAGSDHMLRVDFADTTGVAPVSDQPEARHGQSQPLGQVTYPHLW
jgi:hypothetical protein